jgi:hypothetical protein
MPVFNSPYFALWAAAQADALEAEYVVLRAKLAEADGTGPAVRGALISDAKQSRAKASALLLATIGESERPMRHSPLVH